MRRRSRAALVALLLAVLLLPAVPVAASALAAPSPTSGDTVELAVEATEGQLPGPEPRGPDASANPAAPRNYEPNFTWAASILLLVPIGLGAIALGALYYVLVHRPRQVRPQR